MLSRSLGITCGLMIALFLLNFPLSKASEPQREPSASKAKSFQLSSSSGLYITVQVSPTVAIPYNFWLAQNYPNPYNDVTMIKYSCGKDGYVTLKVYNILGQQLATLISGYRNAGVHAVSWDSKDAQGRALASGVYFYRMIAGSFVETKKLLILR